MSKRGDTSLKTAQPIKISKRTNDTKQQSVTSSKFVCTPINGVVTRQHLKQQSSTDIDESSTSEQLTSYESRRDASSKRHKVKAARCIYGSINETIISKHEPNSREEIETSESFTRETYNLRSTDHGSRKQGKRKLGSTGRDAIQSRKLERSPSSRIVSDTLSTPTQKTSVVARKQGGYNVKTKEDLISCWITGIAITNDGRILVVDRNNRTVKAFSKSMNLQSSLKLGDRIWGITIIKDKEAVVSGDMHHLSAIDISSENLRIIRTYPLKFDTFGACIFNDKLIAVTRDSLISVKMFDLTGIVYWSVSHDLQGQRLYPLCVTKYGGARAQSVVVADQDKNTVLYINGADGTIERQGILKGKPKGVTNDTDGNVYVCLSDTNEIIVLTVDTPEEKVLLTRKEKLREHPHAIVYDKNTQCLLISYMYSDFMDIFQIS